ncbi:MAG: FeoB-associated Cys-rich membrane protein [Lachnospiraceae bacterium]|nr:FeoB-associated Cys-rich membrane protein [Lachnospiraceae bacterium]
MENFVIIAILAVILGAAIIYIVKAKKRGVKCIGCSAGGACHCASKPKTEHDACCDGGCGCGCHADTK